MKVGLYFGSFNPIHIGHLIIADHVANNGAVDQVWFVVTPQNPFKKSTTLLNEYQRLHLVQKAVEDNNRLFASDIEFKLPKPSYTTDTLIYLKEKYPHQFAIIVGSDSFQNIPSWKNGDKLLKENEFLVYPRPGFLVENHQPNVQLLEAPLLEISATTIRKQIAARQSIRYLVTDVVRKEIEDGGYYRK